MAIEDPTSSTSGRRRGRVRVSAVPVLCTTLALTLGVAGTASADGGNKPSTAPTVALGQIYVGNDSDYVADFWKLPPLSAQDKVTIAGRYEGTGEASLNILACLVGNVDDYSWAQSRCNISDGAYIYGTGTRIALTASGTANPAFLKLFDGHGPYHFVVESIQHKVLASITPQLEAAANGTVSMSAQLTDGTPVVGKVFTLKGTWGSSGQWSTTATTDAAGRATFALGLPPDTQGQNVSFVASSEATQTEQASVSVTTPIKIQAAPPPPPPPPPPPAPTPTPTTRPTVQQGVALWTSTSKVRRWRNLTVAGRVTPAGGSAVVIWKKFSGRKWASIATVPVASDGSYSYTYQITKTFTRQYRACAAQSGNLLAGCSKSVTVRVRR